MNNIDPKRDPKRHPPEGLTLILGATGKTGQRVTSRLQLLNQPIRLGSRNATPAFDWTQPTR